MMALPQQPSRSRQRCVIVPLVAKRQQILQRGALRTERLPHEIIDVEQVAQQILRI